MDQVHPLSTQVSTETPAIRLVLLLANSLDCEAISTLFSQLQRFDVLKTTADFDFGLARCRRLCPDVVIVDPKAASDSPGRAIEMTRHGHAGHILILDDRLYESRLATVLAMPAVSYITRQAGFAALQRATIQVVTEGRRVFDPAIVDRICRTPRGLRLDQAHDRPSIASLTPRELEVMRLLAQGRSVRECAKQLQLAESTIDNHKSRLMKKLRIHKAAELTHLAIRDGLITV